jgi:hypothetical protein
LIRTTACSPLAFARDSASTSAWEKITGVRRRRISSRMSTISTAGSGRPPIRSGSSSRTKRPDSAACQVSIEGVADPSTAAAPSSFARTSAMSRAW